MKVVIVGSNGFDTLEHHFADSFQRLGHEVLVLDYDFGYASPILNKLSCH